MKNPLSVNIRFVTMNSLSSELLRYEKKRLEELILGYGYVPVEISPRFQSSADEVKIYANFQTKMGSLIYERAFAGIYPYRDKAFQEVEQKGYHPFSDILCFDKSVPEYVPSDYGFNTRLTFLSIGERQMEKIDLTMKSSAVHWHIPLPEGK